MPKACVEYICCKYICLVGKVDSVGSSSSGVHAQLRQAVQLVIEQQHQLEALRDVVERQNKYISRLCRRDVTLGLELRQSGVPDRNTPGDTSHTTPAQPAAMGKRFQLFIHTPHRKDALPTVCLSLDLMTADEFSSDLCLFYQFISGFSL